MGKLFQEFETALPRGLGSSRTQRIAPSAAGGLRSLADMVAGSFSSSVRLRGRNYYRKGLVKITTGGETLVEALVRGTLHYQVVIALRARRLSVSCTCPYFAGSGPCKHVWATILSAEPLGYLASACTCGARGIEVVAETNAESSDEDDEEALHTAGTSEMDDLQALRSFSGRARRTEKLDASNSPARGHHLSGAVSQWKQALKWIRDLGARTSAVQHGGYPSRAWPEREEILYVLGLARDLPGSPLIVETWTRRRNASGGFNVVKPKRISADQIAALPEASDRRALSLLHGATDATIGWSYGYARGPVGRFKPASAAYDTILPLLCATGRLHLGLTAQPTEATTPLQWDSGPPWEFWIYVRRDAPRSSYLVRGSLRRDGEAIELAEVDLFTPSLFVGHGRVARLDDGGASAWIPGLQARGVISVPVVQGEELVQEILGGRSVPRLDLPAELAVETVSPTPRPRLRLKLAPQWNRREARKLYALLSFDYDGVAIEHGAASVGCFDRIRRRWIMRDSDAERAAFDRVLALGVRQTAQDYERTPGSGLRLAASKMPALVRTLIAEGWNVEAEGKLYRRVISSALEIVSGIDWFELHGHAAFDQIDAPLPALLAALRRQEGLVPLGDGTVGVLPEEWLRRFGMIASLGTEHGDHIRFRHSQIAVLDALIAEQPETRCDEIFARAREEFRTFSGIEPREPSSGFAGVLRPYQRDGLGWLGFLRRFGFGGILADDMGLGKTIQILAMLEEWRENRAQAGAANPRPSLVVVPRSLVFNWRREATRFAPKLRVYDHLGTARSRGGEDFQDHDLIVTTYGTLRRDVAWLRGVKFDCVILDEAQAIKNPSTATAKAVRLLTADHRLALSGTPIENHLGELWSLFEFLNPGMLGASSVFSSISARGFDEGSQVQLARAVRPFVLRRTKDQVARDLPARQEQTIYAELDLAERKAYDELREHYRRTLFSRIERDGFSRAKILVLEALLRLRQAACHRGLLDQSKRNEPGAKLEILLAQIAQVLDEGHKALVFSQFTSLLSIVRSRLDRERIPYEYLDGKTRDREARVVRFQTDPTCGLFLVSLKAGGLGLNLTAAEYVYLLDPWWNPAVEAQAIDRAHRIGQTRQVFAYRLIARDTVEEKVLELQKSKRELAASILGRAGDLMRGLTRADLELLLS